jgi:hypothetical protein
MAAPPFVHRDDTHATKVGGFIGWSTVLQRSLVDASYV